MRYAILCGLLLAGCMQTTAPAPAPDPDDSCGKAMFADLVGEPAANHSFDAAPGDVRVIYPGQAVTMDHRPDRLNVDVNRNGDIGRLWCG
ncbi:hypothetical protein EI983_15565 [Roseovarius faecimaris]|uniref:Peptidase inhibitor I78 n=1 Tax=Roseovarius faecimaris TaxID=2494550 RepID=A0A6I6IW15_9RHOB|nr:I78 family peptidase inhibitor [Roseovarius faecimaris]QGX99606.1 hypothetical protein EI983_15565 [Roseovarius faecimaris]